MVRLISICSKFPSWTGQSRKSGIPYKFIRLGEEVTDIEILENYTDDMPDEIADFVVEVDAYDPDAGLYKEIEEGGE